MGDTLQEIADYLRIHYTKVSKVIGEAAITKKLILQDLMPHGVHQRSIIGIM